MTVYGIETPRLWTQPRRELTQESSAGFSVIAFAGEVLGVNLFPWQKWLLIHALELNEDGTYRFRRVFVLVARQNGKTMLAGVLAAWWFWVDSMAHELAPARDFLIMGAAQNLDLAEDVWTRVVGWGAPDMPGPDDDPASEIIPMLQARTRTPVRTNGRKSVRTRAGATYKARPFQDAARGKSADRLVLDELRTQKNFDGWNAIVKTQQAKFNSQLWGYSNAGGPSAVLLNDIRGKALQFVDDVSTSVAVFDWSGADGCALDDIDAYRQANPSMGYLPGLTIDNLLEDARVDPEWTTRTEVLCQWQTANVTPLIPVAAWLDCVDEGSQIMPGSEMVLAVDIDFDRKYAAVAVAGWRADGLPHVEAIAHRAGIMWTVPFMKEVAAAQGISRVAVRSRGAAASELVGPLRDAGLDVVEVVGPADGQAAGQLRDDVLAGKVRHRGQQPVNDAFSACEPAIVGGVEVFERRGAALSTSPGIACAYALWALRNQSGEVLVSAYEPDGSVDDGVPWWRKG